MLLRKNNKLTTLLPFDAVGDTLNFGCHMVASANWQPSTVVAMGLP
jgi:hypothetical protein